MTTQRHLPGLDGLRGFAVLLVFVYHYGGGTHSSVRPLQLVGFLNKGGWAGVTLFFILSGFLITGILWDSFDDPRWWRNFVVRRTLRIFPLYYAAILAVLLAALAAGTLLLALRTIWVPVLFLQNLPKLAEDINHLSSPLPLFHFWSLAVEEQFYLIWPFLLVLQKTRRRAKLLCLATFAFSCVFRIAVWHVAADPAAYWQLLPCRAGELAAGGWLALTYRSHEEWMRAVRIAPRCAWLGLIGFGGVGLYARSLEIQTRPMMQWGLPSVTLFFAGVLVLALEPGWIAVCARAAWLRWLGGISFGVYVFHVLLGPVFHVFTVALVGGRGPIVVNAVNFLVAAAGTVAVALLSSRFLEQPILKLKSRYASPKPRSAATTPAA